jgi:hypothetical protein
MTRKFEWRERNSKWHYFDTETGMIVGSSFKIALQDVWGAVVNTGNFEYAFKLDDEKPLGHYLEQEYAKKAVERYWDIQSRTLIE